MISMLTSDAGASILADLNEPQRRAVTHRDGPLLVLAGAGSGKTRVITRRAAYLVHTGVPARNIVAITFTNKAADEMRRRIEALGAERGMWIHTFHALGVRLLREFGSLVRVEPGFTIYDQADQLRVLKEAMDAGSVSPQFHRPEAMQARISQAKNRLETPQDCAERAENFEQRSLARVYEAYEELLEQHNAVDFDDLLMRVAVLLRDHPEITERLNARFRYVLIDEYQDTNHAQYLIAHHLSQHHRNICATGDPDQSIYGWRGADIGNILEFERDYPDAVVVRLEQNYRSTPDILRAASKLISANRRRKRKDLWTDNRPGTPVRVWSFAEGRHESQRIAETITALRGDGRPYSDMAIFYRINAISRELEDALRHRDIPYQVARGVEFYGRKEIKDVLAYLRVLVNPRDEIALSRIINAPARGIGKTTLERLRRAAEQSEQSLMDVLRRADEVPTLKAAAAARVRKFTILLDQMKNLVEGSVADAVSKVLVLSGLEAALKQERESGGEDRLANVQELVTAAAGYDEETEEPTLLDFLQRVALTGEQDAVDESAGCVLLMTLHAAKGLEFPVVFMVGLEQGTLPHERVLAGERDIEEERRLCFVGITRAQESLYMTHAQQRLLRGKRVPRCVSQFLHELPDDATVWEQFEPPPRDAAGESPEAQDGFVPLDDQLPPEEARPPSRRARTGRLAPVEDEPCFSPDDPTSVAAAPVTHSPYADWKPGTLVEHEQYGVGQIVWVRPSPGQSRALIRFAGYGEKTFVLEKAPVIKLERR